MSNWIGYAITVNCGEPLGCYQGTILEADGNTITLTKAFRNGFPYPKSQVTLNAADIKELKIIEGRPEGGAQPRSTVAVAGKSRAARTTVCETLQANPTSSGSQMAGGNNKGSVARGQGSGPAPSKPIDIQNNRNKSNNNSGSYGASGSAPKGRDKARARNEECFGLGADTPLDDFDFEGNLALFDKRALWAAMRNKPDLVRHAEPTPSFRHDEPIIPPKVGASPLRILLPPHQSGFGEYHTDAGGVIPAAPAALRAALWAGLAARGLASAADTLLARAAADVALRLAGGARRLHPDNAHQAPECVALVAGHAGGVRGATAARLLASHGVRVTLLVVGPRGEGGALQRELQALVSDGGRVVETVAALPRADVVLLALYDTRHAELAAELCGAALGWARRERAAAVWLEPPPARPLHARAAVQAALPSPLLPDSGQLYLVDVAVPRGLFSELGVTYRSPFGASSVLALHPAPPASPLPPAAASPADR